MAWTLIVLGCPISPSAQETPKNVHRLDAVVVSATRSEIPVFNAPQSVTVLSNEELMASPFNRVEDIVRIEIVRGPTSALYGSERLGSVIHIITKKPENGRQTSVRGIAGTADTSGGSAFYNQKVKDFGFMFAGGLKYEF